MVARLGDSEADVTSPDFEERWRRFLACMNLYQFLANFHFATGSEVAGELVDEPPFEVLAAMSKEWAAVRDGVCSSVRHVVEELAACAVNQVALPQVEYYNENIDDDAFAEMAWPTAILLWRFWLVIKNRSSVVGKDDAGRFSRQTNYRLRASRCSSNS